MRSRTGNELDLGKIALINEMLDNTSECDLSPTLVDDGLDPSDK